MRGSAGGGDEDRLSSTVSQSVSQSVRPTNSKYLTRDNLRQFQYLTKKNIHIFQSGVEVKIWSFIFLELDKGIFSFEMLI